MLNSNDNNTIESIFSNASKNLRHSIIWLIFFSFFISLFSLGLPFYSLQVFDRVLTSHSLDTLWLLSIIVICFLVLQSVLDWIRSRMLLAISNRWNEEVGPAIHMASIYSSGDKNTSTIEIIQLMKSVRAALSSSLVPLFDIPWSPLFILFLTALHPLYGVICASVMMIMGVLAYINYRIKSNMAKQQNYNTQGIQDADSIKALGMTNEVAELGHNQDSLDYQNTTATMAKSINIVSLSKFIRFIAQISLVATGAVLVIDRELTAGAMIAATMIAGKAFSPYDSMVNNLYSWGTASRYWRKLEEVSKKCLTASEEPNLPDPTGEIIVENAMLLYPGTKTPFLSRINLHVRPGECVAIVGDSGSGKSSLLKLLAGLRNPSIGQVRLDGATYLQWYSQRLSSVLGFYSPESTFLSGTILENVARFKQQPDKDKVYASCIAVGMHELILSWPKGYDTIVGKDVYPSSSELHRLLIARTIYAEPILLILDQPDAFLGPSGEKLLKAILVDRKKKSLTTIFATNHSTLLNHSDRIVLLGKGTIESNTPTHKIAQAQQRKPSPSNNTTQVGQNDTKTSLSNGTKVTQGQS